MSEKKCVLIVHDNDQVRQDLIQILELGGYNILAEADAYKALTVLAERTVSVVVCDVQMPTMDGVEFMHKAREIKLIETVLVTGHSTIEKCVKALEFGACGYVAPPLDSKKLILNIERAFRNIQEKTEIIDQAMKMLK